MYKTTAHLLKNADLCIRADVIKHYKLYSLFGNVIIVS